MKEKLNKRQIVGIILTIISAAIVIAFSIWTHECIGPYGDDSTRFAFIVSCFVVLIPLVVLVVFSVALSRGVGKNKNDPAITSLAIILLSFAIAGLVTSTLSSLDKKELEEHANYNLVVSSLGSESPLHLRKIDESSKTNEEKSYSELASKKVYEYVKDLEVVVDTFKPYQFPSSFLEIYNDNGFKISISEDGRLLTRVDSYYMSYKVEANKAVLIFSYVDSL